MTDDEFSSEPDVVASPKTRERTVHPAGISRTGNAARDVDFSSTVGRAFRKYAIVWIWTVLFGSTVGVGFSAVTAWGPSYQRGLVLLVRALFVSMTGIIVLASLRQQVKFLTSLLRMLATDEHEAAGESHATAPDTLPLYRAFVLFVYALSFSILRAALEALYTFLGM